MTVAVISFDGIALAWYRWIDNWKKFLDWDDLKTWLFDRFRPSKEGHQCAHLLVLAIKQETTMVKYRQQFEALSAPLPQISEEVLESTFLNGLDSVIRAEVLAMEPLGLD